MQSRHSIFDSCLVTFNESGQASPELLPDAICPPGLNTLSEWFRCLTELQNATGSLEKFYGLAARAVTNAGGLDGAVVVLEAPTVTDSSVAESEKQQWEFPDTFRELSASAPVRQELLERSVAENGTIYHAAEKLKNIQAIGRLPTVVVAPLRNESGRIIGFLYGWRTRSESNNRFGIRDLEAHFVRLVAQTVSATLVRHQKETELAEKNALLAQAFPKKVIEQLKIDPTIFDGRETVVTTLFVDLRGFSAISNRLPARQTYAMVNEIMDVWTELVMDYSGAVVDYFGDGLVAFWNAPLEVENHAALAVRCAERIRDSLPCLGEVWQSILRCQLDAGIGISTGLAHVGNCGSRHRFKYGPHGANVNLAARLEKLTKELSIPVIISEETARQIEADFLSRRICKAKVPGFDQPVSIFEPIRSGANVNISCLREYEEILHQFENGNLASLEPRIHAMLVVYPTDPALHLLLQRIRVAINEPGKLKRQITTFLQERVTGQM